MARIDSRQALSESDAPRSSEEYLLVVYEQLRTLAAVRLINERPGHTLQATDLVHEAFLRLNGGGSAVSWDGTGHFFAAAAEAMRRILIERARRRLRRQRVAGVVLPLEQLDLASPPPDDLLLALDDALGRLASIDPEAAELVRLRYYAGLTMAQAAQAMDMPLRTAERNWTYGRTWLFRELHDSKR